MELCLKSSGYGNIIETSFAETTKEEKSKVDKKEEVKKVLKQIALFIKSQY